MGSGVLSSLLLNVALAAEPPSVDSPERSGVRSWRDAMVVIGVEDYEHLPDIPHAANDAAAMDAWFRLVRGPSTRRIFTVQNPSTQEMDTALKRGVARVRSRGTLWIYFSGAGWIGDDGVPRLLPADAAPNGLEDAFSLAEVEQMAARSRAERVVILIDAPFDESLRAEMEPGKELDSVAWSTEVSDKVVVWVADTGGSGDVYGPSSHGLFTWLFLAGVQGWADLDGDGVVKLWEAQEFVHSGSALLGRSQTSSVDLREEPRNWALSIGALREDQLLPADWTTLSVEDRDRRMQLAVSEAEESAVEDMLARMASIKQGEAGPELLEDFVSDWEHREIVVRWVPPIEAVDEAKMLLENPEALMPETVVTTEEGDTGDTAVTAPVAPIGPTLSDDTCDDLITMEPDALMGIFGPGRIECVEARISEAPQTEKDKLSRLLLADADSKGDMAEWERLMARHLNEIDRSDPDMCFLYARHTHNKGVAWGEEAIQFADYALENKQKWAGETYTSRLYGLYRLRAEAANELWKDAEQNLIADPTDENDAITQKWRGKSKNYAREWYDYAKASDQNPDRALMICVSAAGTKAACVARD